MLEIVVANQFKKDSKLQAKRNKSMTKLKDLVELLVEEKPLPEHYQDHPLKGEWKDYRDAHIEPDWLLIYGVFGKELHLVRTGTHSDLF